MRRIVVWIALLALVLAACGGEAADTTVGDPPQSKVIETSGNAQVDKVLAEWKTAVRAAMLEQQIKPETIEEKVYQSDASLQQIDEFYKQLTEKSWVVAPRMPGVQNGVLLTGYDIGTTALVIGAIDAAPLGGSGVIVYTAKGNT
ncbi:MAG TPA: hypothetical protein VFU22_24835 [Roseiflexaceae bacterium]|nr:hypothetical protein [Roseiflexaceae bacterium]